MKAEDTSCCYDAAIIGSGAGGAPIAWDLVGRGLNVILLEKGPRIDRDQFRHDEIEPLPDGLSFRPSLDLDPHVLVRAGEKPERSRLGWIGSGWGGGTVRMGGYFYRFHPDDFRMVERFGPYSDLADWPFSYDDLEPFYSRAEWQVGVSGGSDFPTAPRSAPLPMPSVHCHPLAEVLDHACRNLGRFASITPRAVNSQPFGGRPACSYCDFCGGYGCPTGARGSMPEVFLSAADASGRLTVRTETMVQEIVIGRTGRAVACRTIDSEGQQREVRARAFVVAASAVETARLLLLSKSSRFPDGLANSNGRVGRHLHFHVGSTGRGRFRVDRPLPAGALFDRTPYLGRTVFDHYFLPEGVSALPKGGVLRFGLSSPEPASVALRLATEDGKLLWGTALQAKIHDYFHAVREVHFEVFQDYIPNPGTFIELDPEVRDGWGLAAARIHLDEDEHHALAGRWLVDRGLEILAAMGAEDLRAGAIGATTQVHAHGTCRAGDSPEDSVVDREGRTHEVHNLYIADGSTFPSSGGAAPTLTIIANSLRIAQRLGARLHEDVLS